MPDDLTKLQGTWTITSLETEGRTMPAPSFAGSAIVIDGDTFVSRGMGAIYEGTLRVDPAKKPKTFDLLITVGHAAGTRNPGIYRLAGDRWTICLATRGSRRPRTFATAPGSGLVLETLERGKAKTTAKEATRRGRAVRTVTAAAAPASEAAPSGAATELEGEWAMVEGVFNGVAMSPDMVKWVRRITRGDVTSVVAGPQLMMRARFTLAPPAIDYMNLDGPNAGQPQSGIFEVAGGILKVCMAAPGRPRPGDYSSKQGDGRSYTTWRPVKN